VSALDVKIRQSVLDKMAVLKFTMKERNAFQTAMEKLAPPAKAPKK
jgi:hypothetical protein